ncbi:MAG: 50S ribosome-binding GTPase [Actinomycetaceae bacterium]|nr:50S ribosome-binding GTPase [Actinomycetaceae bacterium]
MRIFNRVDDTPVDKRVEQLSKVVELLGDDLPPEERVDYAQRIQIAKERLRLDADTTVVALIGATGSGKSSLFNALLGADLASVGVRRPTTTAALAASAPGTEPTRILDWLGVKNRVLVPAGRGLSENVTVVDLPDIDSVNLENREFVDRLAKRVDVLVWVVDPQKYADDVLHTQFIRPLAGHSKVTLVALSQVDRLTEADRGVVLADLKRLLEEDGLANPLVVPVSSLTGEGIEHLRMRINDVARVQREEAARLNADVDQMVTGLRKFLGESHDRLPKFTEGDVTAQLYAAGATAAGVPVVSQAVRKAYIHRASKAMAWLPLRKLRTLRPDPLRRLHLGSGDGAPHSMQISSAAESALQVRLRDLTDGYAKARPRVWARDMSQVATGAGAQITDKLAHAVSSTKLGISHEKSGWWKFMNVLQWVGWLAAIVGGGWLLGLWLAREFLYIDWEPPMFRALPIPTWLLIGGIAWTLLMALLSVAIARIVASRVARQATRALTESISDVIYDDLWLPLKEEDQRQRLISDTLSRL